MVESTTFADQARRLWYGDDNTKIPDPAVLNQEVEKEVRALIRRHQGLWGHRTTPENEVHLPYEVVSHSAVSATLTYDGITGGLGPEGQPTPPKCTVVINSHRPRWLDISLFDDEGNLVMNDEAFY